MEPVPHTKYKRKWGRAFREQRKVKRVLCFNFPMALSLSFFYNVLIGITLRKAWEKVIVTGKKKKICHL